MNILKYLADINMHDFLKYTLKQHQIAAIEKQFLFQVTDRIKKGYLLLNAKLSQLDPICFQDKTCRWCAAFIFEVNCK